MVSKTLTIQLKRKNQTFFLTVAHNPTLLEIKQNLHQIIEAIGGIGGDLDDEKDAEGNDLDIPIPSFETVDSDEEENDISKTEVDNDRALLNNKFIPGLEELVIGQPRDLNDVYSLGFDKIIEDKYTLQGLKDFSILAFKLADEPFDVLPPKHDEE